MQQTIEKKSTNLFLKRIYLFLLPVVFSVPAYSQLFGVGGQYTQQSDGQFFVNLALPTWTKHNPLHLFNLSGLEYTTSGGARMSGLQLKPVQLSTYLSDNIFYDSPVTLSIGIDAGYLFDFRRHHKNTIVLTPNFYMDYKIFFMKAGYEIDTFHGDHQFFIRAGVGFALGTMKSLR